MLKHQKIRESQAEVRALYAAGVMSIYEFVFNMNRLKVDLEAEEKVLYTVDRRGHLDLLRFVTNTVPDAFMRIHARFPHLTFPEVIAFEQTMRDAGGSVMVHSGVFAPTKRLTSHGEGQGNDHMLFDFIKSWTCCHTTARHTYSSGGGNGGYRITHGAYDQNGVWICSTLNGTNIKQSLNMGCPTSPDLTNPNPIGRCDTPTSFSLRDDTADNTSALETLKDIKVATQARIDETEAEIARLRRKVTIWDDMLTALDRLE